MEPRLAFSLRGQAVDVLRAALWMKEDRNARDYLNLASSMRLALEDWDRTQSLLTELINSFQSLEFEAIHIYKRPVSMPETDVVFFAPIMDPPSLRFFNAFTEKTPEQFTFGNTQTLFGHNQALSQPALTVLPEIGAIVGGPKNQDSRSIAGYCVVNNLQNLTANKSEGLKSGFATSTGPYFITADELETHKLGAGFNLETQVRIGAKKVSGSFRDMAFRFEDMLAAASPTRVLPGDILCSGSPVQTAAALMIESANTQVEVEIQALGTLINTL